MVCVEPRWGRQFAQVTARSDRFCQVRACPGLYAESQFGSVSVQVSVTGVPEGGQVFWQQVSRGGALGAGSRLRDGNVERPEDPPGGGELASVEICWREALVPPVPEPRIGAKPVHSLLCGKARQQVSNPGERLKAVVSVYT